MAGWRRHDGPVSRLPKLAVSPTATPRASPFAALAGANLAAQAAEQISLAAVPIVAVLALEAGPREIGLLAAAQSLPFLLMSMPFGLWADRVSRRRLMAWAEVLRALALLALLAATLSGALSLPLLALLGFAGATGTVAFSVAAPALVPALVPHEALARANGRIELARSLAFAGGPALAGAMVGATGASSAFVLAALLSAAAVALLLRLPEVARGNAPARHPLTELREGAAFAWRHTLLRPVLLTAVVWNIAWFVLQAAYVPHAMKHLGLGAQGVGLTLALYGIGMVCGALAASRLMERLAFGRAICLGPVVSVLAASLMAATLAWPAPWLAAASFFLFGAGPLVWTVSSTTLRQTLTPPQMLGRVGSIFLTVNAGARPLGAALGAAVAAAAGPEDAARVCLLLALAGFVGQALVIGSSAVRSLQRLPEAVR
jgi:predicted MFS family arabinose efflux permease